MLVLVALGLASAALGVCIAVTVGVLVRLARVENRMNALERPSKRVPLEERKGEPWGRGLEAASPLAGLRVSLAVRQDHPHPVFANLLRESLLREEALIDDAEPDLRIEGEVVGNGYADVYFRAELAARWGGETILTLSERPPHGDRPANLAAEIVRKLKDEMDKRERRDALRELHRPT